MVNDSFKVVDIFYIGVKTLLPKQMKNVTIATESIRLCTNETLNLATRTMKNNAYRNLLVKLLRTDI